MSGKRIQLKRGTTAQNSTFTGLNGEVTVDTTKKTLVVHDGTTIGGTVLAKDSDVVLKVDKVVGKQLSTEDYTTAEKSKLAGIASGAQVNVPTDLSLGTATGTTLPLNSSTGTDVVLPAVTTSAAGLMSSTDKTKLDGIATGANNYVLPNASSIGIGGVKVSATAQTVASNTVTATASRTYAVQLDASGNALVNVPWVDTNTIYTHPASGVGAGTYRSVTVDTNGHVTAGTNPTTVSGYGLTDVHTKTEVNTLLALKINNSEKGVANGVATLDVNGKVTLTQIPDSVFGQLEYMGTWNFTTMPTATQKGQYWIANTGGNDYVVGDWAVWNGGSFDKVDNTDAVASVAGRIGNVVLTKSDVGLANVDNTADATKNVLSATKWTTSRNIALTGDVTGNINIDGSANVSIATTIAANSVALGTDTTGNYVAGNTAGTGITVTGTAGEGWSPTISIDSTVATLTGSQTLTNKTLQDSTTFIVDNTDATKKVQFDVAGVTTATTRTMTIPNVNGTLITTGDTGTVTSTMIADGTIINADISASAGIVDTKLATISTAGKVSNSATTATNLNTANAIVARDASGNFSAGTVTASLNGNANTSTTLQTPRTISMSGAITGTATSFDGSANITIPTTVSTTQGGIVYGSSATAYGTTAAGTSGYILSSNGSSAPIWVENTLLAFPGSTFKKSARVATTAALTLNAATATIDGVTLTATDRVLIKNQATASQNGIYTGVTTTTWTRTTDSDSSSDIASAIIAIDEGTANGGRLFTNTFKSTDTIGTTAMAWYEVVYNSGTWAISTTGSAATLTTGRTIGMTGDVAWTSASFNGSANVTGTSTLATITDSGTGTFKKITTDTKGRVTGTQAVAQADITGLLGAGSITNTMIANTAVSNLSGTNTGDQTITLTGDVTGSGTGSFAATLANSGVTAGTYSKVTVDGKGRVTSGSTPTMEDIPDATFKRSVRAATTANITLSAPQTIDGIALVAGDRVLVKDQTTTSQNGIYVVAAGAWTRSLDADTSSKIASALVAVDSGTANGGKLFDNDFKTTDTLGTTAMLWSSNLDSGHLLPSTSTSVGAVAYNGTIAAVGRFDGGTTTPTGPSRLNYGGYFYPTALNLIGSADTATASSHVFVETASDGFIRPKTLANFKTEMFASPTLVTPNIGVATGTSFNSITGLSAIVGTANGTAAVGTSTAVARADHVHPNDTTKITKVASTDNAIVRFSGVSGNIQNSAIKIDDAGNIGSGTQSFNGLGGVGFKNYIINGNFDIWQRGTSQTTFGYASDDRWSNWNNVSTKTHSQIACTDTERALFNASYFSRTVASSIAGATSALLKEQGIEDVTRLSGKTVTLSFWAKADSNKNIAIEFSQYFGTGGTPSAQVPGIGAQLVPLTTAWQKKTITVTIPSIVGKTLGTYGVHTSSTWVRFWFDAGSDYNSRTANLGQQSGTFDIAQVQLEEGSVATPFEQRPYGLELSLCQRYYQLFYMFDNIAVNQWLRKTVYLPTSMRVVPTVANVISTVGGTSYEVVVGTNNNTSSLVFYNFGATVGADVVLSGTASAEL